MELSRCLPRPGLVTVTEQSRRREVFDGRAPFLERRSSDDVVDMQTFMGSQSELALTYKSPTQT